LPTIRTSTDKSGGYVLTDTRSVQTIKFTSVTRKPPALR